MPPRRSCFPSGSRCRRWRSPFQCHHGVPACPASGPDFTPKRRFNATTAFLLSAGGLRSWPPAGVSMPPRRSCLIPSVRDHRCLPLFQCHHGVPAIAARLPPATPPPVSMPPRRSCLEETMSYLLLDLEFQCHHGVPASKKRARRQARLEIVSMPPRRSCFTQGDVMKFFHVPFQCHHGVPACCPAMSISWWRLCFNATTAFLLPVAQLAGVGLG